MGSLAASGIWAMELKKEGMALGFNGIVGGHLRDNA